MSSKVLAGAALVLACAATGDAYVTSPLMTRSGRAGTTALKMTQPPGPSTLPMNLAKKNCLEQNKKQWGITEAIKVDAGAAPAAAAAPAPKKAAAAAPAKKAAASDDEASVGFTGVPSAYARPGQTVFGNEGPQTVFGARGPRAEGHREMFGSRHAAVSLAACALLWQPISQAGMYTANPGSPPTKASFSSMEVPGFGEAKKVPSIESFFPFQKNGFSASGTLFGKDSMIVYENPLKECGAYASTCHTFLDEIGDMLKATPKEMPRSEGKATYSFPWMYDHAAWKK